MIDRKIFSKIISELTEKEKKHDQVLIISREIIRDCANAIKDIHLGKLNSVEGQVKRIKEKLLKTRKQYADFESNLFTANQEYAEVALLYSILKKEKISSPKNLGVDSITWLNGLADCTGELRRQFLIALIDGQKSKAKHIFSVLEEIYEELMTVKFGQSLVGPLKHKQDVLRSVVESCRSELVKYS
ncbi:Translin family protein [uncultured archaeon]|nr:Translin family protein [uncultured archaeon]